MAVVVVELLVVQQLEVVTALVAAELDYMEPLVLLAQEDFMHVQPVVVAEQDRAEHRAVVQVLVTQVVVRAEHTVEEVAQLALAVVQYYHQAVKVEH
jgi:hypothetical protein